MQYVMSEGSGYFTYHQQLQMPIKLHHVLNFTFLSLSNTTFNLANTFCGSECRIYLASLYRRLHVSITFQVRPKCRLCRINNIYLSRPDLREPFYVSILVWAGCDLGGHSMICFLGFCASRFCLGMVLNQGQLSLIENHT